MLYLSLSVIQFIIFCELWFLFTFLIDPDSLEWITLTCTIACDHEGQNKCNMRGNFHKPCVSHCTLIRSASNHTFPLFVFCVLMT